MTKEAIAENPESSMAKEEKISGRTAFNHMRSGDASAKAVVDKYIKHLAAGVTNTINIFQPDVLCIGGGVCNEGDPLLVPMKEIVAKDHGKTIEER
jgi:glucokinase